MHISTVYKHTRVHALTQSSKGTQIPPSQGQKIRKCGLVVGAVYLDGKGLPKVPMLEGRAVGNLTDNQHTIYHLFVRLGYWGCSEWNTNGNDLDNLAVDTTASNKLKLLEMKCSVLRVYLVNATQCEKLLARQLTNCSHANMLPHT